MSKRKYYKKRTLAFLCFTILYIFLILIPPAGYINPQTIPFVSFVEFENNLQNQQINHIYFSEDCEYVYVVDKTNAYYKTNNPSYDTFKRELLSKEISVSSANDFLAQQDTSIGTLEGLLAITLSFATLSFALRWWNAFVLEKQRKEMDIFKNVVMEYQKQVEKEQPVQEPPVQPTENTTPSKTFADIAGLKEVKKDVECLVDFLKNSEKYTNAGAILPKGVIFYGPPGTGKTLLAKAIAGEAGIPFHYMSGSDFVEMYVGVGAKRVRELFDNAKKQTPCIIFIDEIDSIGGRRSREDNSAEDRKTLNALLAEMDGFEQTSNILVIGATNRIEDLDDALLRPGRFTNKYCVPLPETAAERLEIIKLYAKNKKFDETVDFNVLSKETVGFSPASIEALLNESAIISVQDDKQFIDKESIDKAILKMVLSGHIKENQSERDKQELVTVAWHEAGHALVGKLNGKSVPKVTILSTTSGAGGVTFLTPKQTALYTTDDLRNEVVELYAGRAAEFLLNRDKTKVTTGASNDIKRATQIIKDIVSSYGMSEEFGLLNLEQLRLSQSDIISQEVKLAKELESKTIDLLQCHVDELKTIAELLLKNETIYEKDLDNILQKKEVIGDEEE